MIVIGYDGSPDAQAAVERAARLLPAQAAAILTVCERYSDLMGRAGGGMLYWPAQSEIDQIDAAAERAAQERAEEGAARARAAGLDAQARTCARDDTIAHTILEQARALDAAAIVLGTRGLTGMKSMLLGSVSHSIVQHADRPVIVVPSAELAGRRTGADR